MKKLLLASVGLLALGVASASAADIPRRQAMPAKAPVYIAAADLQLDRLLCRHQRRRRLGPFRLLGAAHQRLVRHLGRAGRRHARLQLADRARSCSASKATSTGATSAAAAPAPALPARRATTGSAPCAAVSATRSTASCPTSPAAPPSATSRPRSPASAMRATTKAGWTRRRRHRSRDRRTVDRQGRISLCRSRPRRLGARLRRELPHQHRARRPQLPVLSRTTAIRNGKAPESAPGLLSLRARHGAILVAAKAGTCAANLSCQASRRG